MAYIYPYTVYSNQMTAVVIALQDGQTDSQIVYTNIKILWKEVFGTPIEPNNIILSKENVFQCEDIQAVHMYIVHFNNFLHVRYNIKNWNRSSYSYFIIDFIIA